MIIGRNKELKILEESFANRISQIVVITGRRRIGKSVLVHEHGKNKLLWAFEGLERQTTPKQIAHFKNQMQAYFKDPLLKRAEFANWSEVFDYLTEKLKTSNEKVVLFLDEISWMAAGHSALISLLKYYWDNHWKSLNLQLILCGSIASFMVDKVIRSKALYGRIDCEISLEELKPFELKQFFGNRRSLYECLKYILVFGGVPKYFELIDPRYSFEINIKKLFFRKEGYLFNEYEKIFYSQFKEYKTYEQIISLISTGPKRLNEIATGLKMRSSGGINRYLRNLEMARFIRDVPSFGRSNTKLIKYKLFDEYLRFYFKYIKRNRSKITNQINSDIFGNTIEKTWKPWLGIAFENFCLKYSQLICAILGVSDLVEELGPVYIANELQIDLLIQRTDKTWMVCECKFHEQEIGVEVVKEFESKINQLKLPRNYSLEKVLITVNGMDRSLVTLGYFDRCIKLEDFFIKY